MYNSVLFYFSVKFFFFLEGNARDVAIGLENPFPPPARRAAPRHGRTAAAACRGPGWPLGRRRRVRGGDTKGFLLFEFYVSVSPGHRTGTGTRRHRRRRRLLHYIRGTTHTRRVNNNNKINKKEEKNYAAAARTRDTHSSLRRRHRRHRRRRSRNRRRRGCPLSSVVRTALHARAPGKHTRTDRPPSARRRTDYTSRGGEKIILLLFSQRSGEIFLDFFLHAAVTINAIFVRLIFFFFLIFYRVICSSIIIIIVYITVFLSAPPNTHPRHANAAYRECRSPLVDRFSIFADFHRFLVLYTYINFFFVLFE